MNRHDAPKAIFFDLDGTLVKSKQPLDREAARLLSALTREKTVAIAGGGKLSLFRSQVVAPMVPFRPKFENLLLFTTNSSALYRYRGGWRKVYDLKLSPAARERIKRSIKAALPKASFVPPKRLYGPQIEDRGSQVTFSALGQRAPLRAKGKWNRTSDIRPKLVRMLQKSLPSFGVREGGLTSVDITEKGIDKGHAIRRFLNLHHFPKNDVLFIGDAIFPGGNDYPAKKTGVPCLKVTGPEETKRIIRRLLA